MGPRLDTVIGCTHDGAIYCTACAPNPDDANGPYFLGDVPDVREPVCGCCWLPLEFIAGIGDWPFGAEDVKAAPCDHHE